MGRLNEPLVTALRVNHHNRTRVIHRVGAWFFVWDFSKGNVHLLGKVNRRLMRAGHPLKGGIERCKIPTKLIWRISFWIDRHQMHCRAILYSFQRLIQDCQRCRANIWAIGKTKIEQIPAPEKCGFAHQVPVLVNHCESDNRTGLLELDVAQRRSLLL